LPTAMPMDDAALLERWTRRRDTEAFNEIVERFAGQVYVTCRRVLNNDADAEEVAQECFFALARFSGEVRSSLGGWLHGVATYKSRDRIRGDARRRNRESAYGESLPESVDPQWNDIREHVDLAIEALPEELRDVVVAHFLGRKSHAEIAAELGLSRRAVSYRIARGLEAIRSELRRRGVAVSVAVLGTSLAADVSAAPLSLKASLGKLVIAAGTTSGVGGSTAISSMLGSLVLMKAKSFVVAGVLIALAAGLYFALARTQSETPDAGPGTEVAVSSGASEAVATSEAPAPAPPSNTVSAASIEKPSLSDLLALSRTELERPLQYYPAIEDPAQYASVSGVVLDQGGVAVAGALIAIVPTHNWGTLPSAGEIARTATSGADGNYRIGDIKRGGDFRVVASKLGFASEAQYASVQAGKDAIVDFTIKNGPNIEGRVVSASGEPVPDAYIYCVSMTGPRQLVNDLSRATQTDPEGHFTMGFKEEERGFVAALRVQSSKFGAATFPTVVVPSDHVIELRLAAPAVIHGTVKDRSGKPLSDAHVQFFTQKTIDIAREDGERWSSPSYAGSFVAVSDASGRYATEVDAGMDIHVKVEVHGFDDGRERLEKIPALAAGETREYNAVFDTKSISVRATFVGQNSGQPFASYVPVEGIAFRDGREFARAQQDGHFALRFTLPAEKASYTFQARYMYDDDVAGNISKPYKLRGGDDIEIELDLPDPQSFSVRSVDSGGRPVEGASVEFMTETWGGGPLKFGTTNAEGRLDQPILIAPLSGAQLLVEAPGYAIAHGPAYTDQAPGTVHPEETIVLWPGAGFEGVVTDGEKHPLADTPLAISVTNRDGQVWPIQATTDSLGHFIIVNQAPADVVDIAIAARSGSGAWTGEQLQLVADAITPLGEVILK
jgi:RNA polymerase sigma factor (sigma-70 family)